MARRRYVSTTISQDTRVNKLAIQHGDFAALLYTWMIPHAADDATLPGDPEELLYQVLPGRRDKSEADVRAALDGMAALGLISATEDGRIMFPPVAFYRYQPYIKSRNRHGDDDAPTPPHDGAQPQEETPRADSGADQRTSAQKSVSFSPSFPFSPSSSSSSPPPKPPKAPPEGGGRVRAAPKPTTLNAGQRERFDRWYPTYPNKQHRPEAERAFARLDPDDPLTARLIADTAARQQGRKWAGGYIEHPATYLNNRAWEDDIEPVRAAPVPLHGANELIGKDRERAEVSRRVLARRGYGPGDVDADTSAHGGGVSRLADRTGA